MFNCIDLSGIPRDDIAFVTQRLSCFPPEIQRILLEEYFKRGSKFERNTYLRLTVDDIADKLSISVDKLKLNLSEDDLREQAQHLAKSVLALRREYLNDELAIDAVRELVKQHGISVNPDQYQLSGEISRYSTDKWWLRNLRKSLRRNIETTLHHLNQVNKRKSLYCSNPTLIARKNQRINQQQYMENTIVTNELGQSFSLYELSQKGVSDPKIRQGELMLRIRGLEELAKELGHVATFLTFTCPSRYHRSYAKSGDVNPRWDGSTPLEGQEYLNEIWKLIRSKLNRLGIRFYGFRVAEPQHDGTPHWHMLLFVEECHYEEMIAICREYALREDSDEAGALEHRFTEVKIDPKKGSATGYIAKYIAKNINGSGLDSGVYGEDPQDAAARVDAWASCWGIRQFQQIGGCSVTVWRELRRLKAIQGMGKLAKAIFHAADTGDWKGFTLLMGGVFAKRTEQVFKPFYEFTIDKANGVIRSSQYDENELVRVLKGISAEGQDFVSRIHEWQVESKLQKAS